MLIKEMFSKRIDRDVKGVIKAGQTDEETLRRELEEYVVTDELQKHFADFFAAYRKGIVGNTDHMGVWVSGFFGSGKSHFLKMLSCLLINREVSGKRTLEYFTGGNKITDPLLLENMKLAAGIADETDAVLFNIDSKSETAGEQSKDAVVSVFLKVFNEMLGYCGSIPALADLERNLSESGRYDEFQEKFRKSFGKPWPESRHQFDFIQDTVVEVLTEMDYMSEAAARNWCEKAAEPYNISIEGFARLVKEYIDRRGNNHHVVFLADEIGQYIGTDSRLMLNLQTVAEDLDTACRGKAWVVVTSQQDMDSLTRELGPGSGDFSKIQGRFDTRFSLSSANADEVIKKRILDKTPAAGRALALFYEQKATVIKNLIVFSGGAEQELYPGGSGFAAVYPFVPYQFGLLSSALASMRAHGASGRHLSEGERSMLAIFQESAVRLKDYEAGAIVPFYDFYDALHPFLDYGHGGVLAQAQNEDAVHPGRREDSFRVDVLKTLLLLRYAREIAATADNLTSLMADHIDADRIELKKRVEEALRVLVHQALVQKNGDVYLFLTEEEQAINREIENRDVETAEVIDRVSKLIFEEIYSEKEYRYPAFRGRYRFAFNRTVDDRPYQAGQNHDIGVRVLTPGSGYGADEAALRRMSGQGREVLVVLPDDGSFLEELRSTLKIEKYLRLNTAGSMKESGQIREAKAAEMRERSGNARLFLAEAMKNAEIYVNGDRASIGPKEVAARMNDALDRLVAAVYHKLPYIDAAMGESDIRALFQAPGRQTSALESGAEPNANALNDMKSFIASDSVAHGKTSMKSLMDRFRKAPYGFVKDDVEWLVAKLFQNGDISFTVDGSSITTYDWSEDEIIRAVTKKEFAEKLLIERCEKATDSQKKSVRAVMKELFRDSGVNDDDTALMRKFRAYGGNLLDELEQYERMVQEKPLPGGKVILSGKSLLRAALQTETATEFFAKIHSDRDAYLDFAEDYEPVQAFFKGEQKAVFERALSLTAVYDESKTFIADEKIESLATEIQSILHLDRPYSEIPRLPGLLDRFAGDYDLVLRDVAQPMKEEAAQARARVLEELKGKRCEALLSGRYARLFGELADKIGSCNNVARLQGFRAEIDALKLRLLNEISAKEQELLETKAHRAPPPKLKIRKNISVRSIGVPLSWQIEGPQDLERYLDALKDQILKQLEEDTIVNLEL